MVKYNLQLKTTSGPTFRFTTIWTYQSTVIIRCCFLLESTLWPRRSCPCINEGWLLYVYVLFLFRHSWCMTCEGDLLLFMVQALTEELNKYGTDDPHPFEEDLDNAVQQCFYCLFSHRSKKAKYLDDHNVAQVVFWHYSYHSFIHSGYFYSTSSSPLLLRGAPDYSIDTVLELTCWSVTGNYEWITCPRFLRGG